MSFTNRISELIKDLKTQGIRKYEIADVAGYSRGITTQWENGTTTSISPEGAINIEKKYGYNHRWLLFGEQPKLIKDKPISEDIANGKSYQSIKFINFKLKTGTSNFTIDYLDANQYPPLLLPNSWFKKHNYTSSQLFATMVCDNAMSPTLNEGCIVIVNTETTEPKDDSIFMFNYHGTAIIKRLIYDLGKYWLVSDNNSGAYPRVPCDEKTIIIGKIIYSQGEPQ